MTRDDSTPAAKTSDAMVSRRDLLSSAAAFAAACAMCSAAGDVFGAPPDAAPAGEFDAGPVAAFAADGVFDANVKTHKVLILRTGKQLVAASAICPHRNKLVQKTGDADPAIKCPAHDSTFDANGIVLNGPAKTSLPRFAVRIDKGHLFVDTSKSFEEHDWKDPKASVSV